MLLVITFILVAHSIFVLRKKIATAFSPLLVYYAGFFYVIVYQSIIYGPYLLQWNGATVLQRMYDGCIFSLGCVIVGYHSSFGTYVGKTALRLNNFVKTSRVDFLAGTLLAIGLVGWLLRFESAGGFGIWIQTSRGGTDLSFSGYLNLLAELTPVGLSFYMINSRYSGGLSKQIICFGGASILLLWYFYTGSRSLTITWAAAMAAAWYVPVRKNPPFILAVTGLLCLVMVANYLALFRSYQSNLSIGVSDMSIEEVTSSVLDYASGTTGNVPAKGLDINVVANVFGLVPTSVDYRPYALVEFLTRPIPRAFWPEKPTPFYEAMTPIFQQSGASENWMWVGTNVVLTGPSMVHVGFWYAVGGFTGLLFGGLLIGSIFRAYDTFLRSAFPNVVNTMLFLTGVTIAFVESLSTSLFWIFTLPFVLIPILLVRAWTNKDYRTPSTAIDVRRRSISKKNDKILN